MSDKKTKFEDIFSFKDYSDQHGDWNYEKICEEADKYADQETAPLKQRIQELENELLKTKVEALGLVKGFEKRYDDVKEKADYMAEALELVKAGYNPCIPNGVINELDKALNDYRGIK